MLVFLKRVIFDSCQFFFFTNRKTIHQLQEHRHVLNSINTNDLHAVKLYPLLKAWSIVWFWNKTWCKKSLTSVCCDSKSLISLHFTEKANDTNIKFKKLKCLQWAFPLFYKLINSYLTIRQRATTFMIWFSELVFAAPKWKISAITNSADLNSQLWSWSFHIFLKHIAKFTLLTSWIWLNSIRARGNIEKGKIKTVKWREMS